MISDLTNNTTPLIVVIHKCVIINKTVNIQFIGPTKNK